MQFRAPKNDGCFIWTRHVIDKMRYYRLSPSRVRRLMTNYERQEQGIAKNTIALGRRIGTKRTGEIWLMYQPYGRRIKIISAWRYPGISPRHEGAPIPEDIRKELENAE
ncbi:hypothetical protein MYX07_04950 [Patescibacteria group bacterium AH-259-L07]|nr:hypothetical protein [Patescibacteria group bacterium AH-259-L07]